MRSWGVLACFSAALIVACGDNDGPAGPPDLIADPAVETGCLPAAVAAGTSRAKRVDCADEVPPGLLAAGRVGDVMIENARTRLIVRASGEGFVFPGTGPGSIIDISRDGADDAVLEIIPLAALNSIHADEVVILEAGDDGPATIAVRGHVEPIGLLNAAIGTARAPVVLETHYILEPDADELLIRSVLYADEDVKTSAQIGDMFFYGGALAAWLPGTGIATEISNAEFVASRGNDASFGVVYPAEQRSVQFLSIESITGALGPTVEVGGDSAQAAPVDRYVVFGDGSVSSITDRAWVLRGVEVGSVTGTSAPGVDIVARDAADRPITSARSGADGRYALTLPTGIYELVVESAAHGPADPVSVTVTPGNETTADVGAGPGGSVQVTVTDAGITPLPARLVFTSGGDRRIHHAGPTGALTVALPAGDWVLDVSRGVEYDAFTVDPLTVTAGQETVVTAELNQVLDTSGWISMDTHLHSEMSLDSTITLADRLRSVAAEGVEVAVSTDHDFISDYSPVITSLGLEAFVAHRTGVETSTFAFGHINTWPHTREADRAAGGAFAWYGLPPGDIFSLMRERSASSVIQVNHPRDGSSAFFDLIDFNRETGMATQDPATLGFPGADFNDFNFDAIEVGNDFNDTAFAETFPDYLALVAAGHPAAALGSSDSHGASAYPGNSRTYVFVGVGNDTPATVDLAALDQAVLDRKVVVSQGAFVTAGIEVPGTGAPAAVGETVDLSGETNAIVHIKVQAPPWMQLASIVVYHGRDIATTQLLDNTATAAVRFDSTITVALDDTDDFITILVLPAGRGDPVLGQPDGSFTNPLQYDRDGDGLWLP